MSVNLIASLDKNSIDDIIKGITESINKNQYKTDSIVPSNQVSLKSIKDMCEIFKVSRVTIHKWMKDGRIPYRKVNRRVYFILDEVLNHINKYDLKSVASIHQTIIQGKAK